MRTIFALSFCAFVGCATASAAPGPHDSPAPQPTLDDLADARARADRLAPVIALLGAGNITEASTMLGSASIGPEALALRALLRWLTAAHDLVNDGRTVVVAAMMSGSVNAKYLTSALDGALAALAAVDADLAEAQRSSTLALELCPACWNIDWNVDGRADDRDRDFLEVEVDADGAALPAADARRRPTFALDRGDVAWARAMVAFQRAALEVVLAYRWGDLGPAVLRGGDAPEVVVHLDDPAHITRAAGFIAAGIAHSRWARREYLAETDDDREWLPSPRQKSHAIPLPVDEALYATWAEVLDDGERLLSGEEGVELAAVAAVAGPAVAARVHGFADVHAMLTAPGDLHFDRMMAGAHQDDPQVALRGLLGDAWRESMRPSAICARLARMQREVETGVEPWARKLRYLLWLN